MRTAEATMLTEKQKKMMARLGLRLRRNVEVDGELCAALLGEHDDADVFVDEVGAEVVAQDFDERGRPVTYVRL